MRWIAPLLVVALVTALAPIGQATSNCDREYLLPINGLREVQIETCDKNYDGAPDRVNIRAPDYATRTENRAGQEHWGGSTKTTVHLRAVSGYPAAPEVSFKVIAVDEEHDGFQDRIYLELQPRTAFVDPITQVYLELHDFNGDGWYDDGEMRVCSSEAAGVCFNPENLDDLFGLAPGFDPEDIPFFPDLPEDPVPDNIP